MRGELRIVLDTNTLLVSISSRSKYHWLYQNLLKEKFQIFFSNEILTEYEEIISQKFDSEVAQDVIRSLLALPHAHQIDIFYHWHLISNDPDDNKFVDCAVSANVDYLVSNDRHFKILESIEFPLVKVVTIDDFNKFLKV